MKKLYTLCIAVSIYNSAVSQNWVNGGNTLSANGTIGTNSSHSLLFETSGVERGRITNGGNWAIGSTGTSSRFTVNAVSGASPFRAQINGGTKLVVGTNGGVSVGTATAGPANGLYVVGKVGIGFSFPNATLDVNGNGNFVSATTTALVAMTSASGAVGLKALGHIGITAESNATGGDAIRAAASGASGYGIFASSNTAVGVYGTTGNSNSYAGYFVGRVYSAAGYTTSDLNLKKNINAFQGALEKIRQLQPKTYEFRNDGSYALMNLPKGMQHGLVAQDVEGVFPGMVADAEFDVSKTGKSSGLIRFKVLNYTELIPVLVAGMQEQQNDLDKKTSEIDQLKEEIAFLKEAIAELKGTNIENKGGWIKQSVPNPVRSTAIIQYSVSTGAKAARILFTNIKGQQLKIYNVTGNGTINFSAGTLPSGTYNYSLIVDGNTVSTRKMIIAR